MAFQSLNILFHFFNPFSVSLSRQSLSIHVLPSPAEVFGDCAHFMWTNPTSVFEANRENNEKGL